MEIILQLLNFLARRTVMADEVMYQMNEFFTKEAAKRAVGSDAVPCPACHGKGRLYLFWICECCRGFKYTSQERAQSAVQSES